MRIAISFSRALARASSRFASAGFASVRSGGPLESDRCRESGATVSRLCVSGSPPITQDAGFVVTSAIHPTADTALGSPAHAGIFNLM
jgi:hypothetical protein